MNYQKIYINLMDRAQGRVSQGYVEKQHSINCATHGYATRY